SNAGRTLSGEGTRQGLEQNLRDLRNVQGLFQEVDSAAMGELPTEGCQSSCRRGVAAFTRSLERQQGKNPEHHARSLQSRSSLGVARTESHHAGASKLQADAHSGCLDSR